MIDKYGNEQTIGSKEFEEYLHYRMDKEFCNDIACGHMNKESAIQYAHEFYTYALDLQEEVKRLRERLDLAERYIIEPTLTRNYFADVVSKDLNDERDNLG